MYEMQYDETTGKFLTPTGKIAMPYLRSITTITSAQLLALNTTPIKVVSGGSALGADEFFQIHAVKLTFNPKTTAYTIGSAGNFTVNYSSANGPAATGALASAGLIDQTATSCGLLLPLTGLIVAQGDLYLCLSAANPSAGDGTLTVNVLYRDPVMRVLDDDF